MISPHSIRLGRPAIIDPALDTMVRLVFLSFVLLQSGMSAFAGKVRVNDGLLHKILYHVAFYSNRIALEEISTLPQARPSPTTQAPRATIRCALPVTASVRIASTSQRMTVLLALIYISHRGQHDKVKKW